MKEVLLTYDNVQKVKLSLRCGNGNTAVLVTGHLNVATSITLMYALFVQSERSTSGGQHSYRSSERKSLSGVRCAMYLMGWNKLVLLCAVTIQTRAFREAYVGAES